jgi:zinc/manganese transport system substrate-binding protein
VIAQITADYSRLDPAGTSYYQQRKTAFENVGLATYNSLISQIRSKYAGTPIGASESIVSPLAQGLGLRVLTPQSFLDAISEGTEPTVHDKALIDEQIKGKQIKIYVYNSQNATPDVTAQASEARAVGIPVVTVTETLAPANVTFQSWQVAQLRRIDQALAQASLR